MQAPHATGRAIGRLSRILVVAAFGVGLMALPGIRAALAKTELLVYTAVEADELNAFKRAFEQDHPDISIRWVRDSTGIITAKLLAEKDNPQADVVWGLAATSLMLLADHGYFQPYAPKGLEAIDLRYRDPADPPVWVGQRAWIAAVCFNTVEASNKGLPTPATWRDLTDPVYRGLVTMPNPNSSGTGFLNVSAWIQMWGEEEAWKFMDALHNNIAWYTHSGSKPCRQAASGEVPVGSSFAYRGAKSKAEGAPIEVITPAEGLGWDLEAFAIVKTTSKLDAAKVLADWSVSRKANEMYVTNYEVVAMKGVTQTSDFLPPNLQDLMIDNDFAWAAANRERLLAEWQRRYDAKSEAK